MRNIVIIDDKDHALKQAVYEFPNIDKNDLSFLHFDTIEAFRKAELGSIFLIFLDFFLSKDRDYGTSLIPELECEHLICFSSMKEMSDHMYEMAIKTGKERIKHVYSVHKLKDSINNVELQKVLANIFGPRTGRDRVISGEELLASNVVTRAKKCPNCGSVNYQYIS